MVELSKDERRAALIKTIAIQFAQAAGYELIQDNINQWEVAIDTLLRGVAAMIKEDNQPITDITMRHTDINS